MTVRLKGKAIKYGDNVDTDVIIPGRYGAASSMEVLARHCMEDVDPDFHKKAKAGDIIVAGSNFGCGSSREMAPLAIKAASISCVVAKSFARIFFRNSINIGLPILEAPDAVNSIEDGDQLEIDISEGVIWDLSRGLSFKAKPLPGPIKEIVELGGLVPYVQKRLKEKSAKGKA